MTRPFRFALSLPIALAAVGAMAVMSGCTVEGRTGVATYPDSYATAYVYDDSPGYAIETYPAYVYGGTTVYLVGDRWYYRHGGRWAYYSSEPPALYGYRQRYYRNYGYSAPPAYGRPPPYRGGYAGRPYFAPPAYGHSAPPAYGHSAPPAYGHGYTPGRPHVGGGPPPGYAPRPNVAPPARPNNPYRGAPPPRRHH